MDTHKKIFPSRSISGIQRFFCGRSRLKTILFLVILCGMSLSYNKTNLIPKTFEDVFKGSQKLETLRTRKASREDVIHIALTGQLSSRHPDILERMGNVTKSIYRQSGGGKFMFHIFTDLDSDLVPSYEKILEKLNKRDPKVQGSARFYDLTAIFKRYENTIEVLIYNYWDRSSIDNPEWAKVFRSPLIFLRPIYYLLDELRDVDKIISPDSDMLFMRDIFNLYSEFFDMNSSQVMAMGPEFVYCEKNFQKWNEIHPVSQVAQKNHVCVNGGLQLSDLGKLRRNKIFNYRITEKGAHELTDKYRMAMYLGDQDMLTLIKTEHPELFRVLDCRWNYQLNAIYHVGLGWRMPCDGPGFLYHGNSLQKFPPEVYKTIEDM